MKYRISILDYLAPAIIWGTAIAGASVESAGYRWESLLAYVPGLILCFFLSISRL